MTREKQIKREGFSRYTLAEEIDAFVDGALWADQTRWHKASEELPTRFGDYLVVIESQQFGRRCALKCWYGYPKDLFGDNPSKNGRLKTTK